MIRLVYSNHVERLVDVLAARLDRRVESASDIFVPQFVVVPNENVEAFLKLQLSQRNGIAANLRFESLLQFFESRLPPTVQVAEDEPPRRPRLVDEDVLHAVLLGLLGEQRVMGRQELWPLRRYLEVPGEGEGQREMRRFQLAGQLAHLFMEYRFARPEMIVRWRSGTVLDGTRWAATERWQRALWLEVHGPGGALWRTGRDAGLHWVQLERLLLDRFTSEHLVAELPPAVHVFGYSHVSRAFREVFMALGEHTELFIYHLNPCMEFWEDVLPRWKHPRLSGRFELRHGADDDIAPLALDDLETDDPFGLQSAEDNPALQLWGRPGRETIRLLNALTQCDFESAFVDPVEEQATTGRFVRGEPCSLLAQLQRDILFREPPPPHGAASPLPLFATAVADDDDPQALTADARRDTPDGSIALIAAPSIQREVEIIASHIWQMVHEDAERGGYPPLRFNDIAVLVPAAMREAYLTRIQAVFNEAWELPHNVIDLGAGAVSRFAEAVGLLLDLPFGEFTREELLVLVTHPNLVEHLDGIDTDEWIAWCDELGIVHGADHSDHAETYIDEDLFNWDQGLKRLALGAFMAESPIASPDAPLVVQVGAERYAPRPVPLDRLKSAATLAHLVRDLIGDARFARRARLPLAEWARFFITQVVHYLRPAADGDAFLVEQCTAAFEAIASLDLDGRAVGYRTAHALARKRLAELDARRGQYLADGVVVSSLAPMRAMPFRAVFVAGLGEGAFPAPDPRSPLDLRGASRRPGDVSPRERDLYLFLETVISTRDRLFLSYVARDEQTGEPLAPSAVIDELRGLLGRCYLTPQAVAALTEVHPLRRFDRLYFPDLAELAAAAPGEPTRGATPPPPPNHVPEARIEAQIAALRQDLEQTCAAIGADVPDRAALASLMSPSEYAALEELLALPRFALALDVPRRAASRAAELRSDPALAASEALEPEVQVLTLAALRRFLESPLQGAARDLLRMSGEAAHDELLSREDEAFEADPASNVALLRDVILESLGASAALDDGQGATLSGAVLAQVYDARVGMLQRMGHHPIGPFAVAQRRRDLEALGVWRSHLQRIGLIGRGRLRRVAFGQGSSGFGLRTLGRNAAAFDATEPLPPIALRIERGATSALVEIHGVSEPLYGFGAESPRPGALTLVRGAVEPRHFLRGFLTHVALAAAGHPAPEGFETTVASTVRLRNAIWATRFAPLSIEEARRYLTFLAAEMLSRGHDYLLPIEAVCDSWLNQRWALASRIEWLRDNPRRTADASLRDEGPVRDSQRYGPPDNPDQMACQRLGLFLEAIARRQPL